jgi:hypothetical protein
LAAQSNSRRGDTRFGSLGVARFARKPTPEHINKNAQNKKVAYENIIWALLNTKEFVFNQ